MLLSPHVATGAAIGVWTGDPWLALVVGLLSHFALDMIPHYDYNPRTRRNLPYFATDILLGIVFWLVIVSTHPGHTAAALAGTVGAVAPDVVDNVGRLMTRRKVPWLSDFQNSLHFIRPGLAVGMATQICYLGLLGLALWL